MPLHQVEAFAIVGVMFALFITGRLRYDLVACLALFATLALGVVPSARGFAGFGNPVIIVIASVLVLSRAVAVSGLLDDVARRLMRRVESASVRVTLLTMCVTFLSAFLKNVGTLGMFMPIAIGVARRSHEPPSIYLMPLAFGSLIGGTMTQIGTSPNLLICTVREQLGRGSFQFFDFVPVGLPLACLAVVFLGFGWRLLPRSRGAQLAAGDQYEIERYTSELQLPRDSPVVGKSVAELEALTDGELTVAAIIREHGKRYVPSGHWLLYPDDILIVQADPTVVKFVVDQTKAELVGAKQLAPQVGDQEEIGIVEAVVTGDSVMVGHTPRSIDLRRRFEVNVLSVSRADRQIRSRLRFVRFQIGDVVVIQGWQKQLPATLRELGCLPLADRGLVLGSRRRAAVPIAALAIALLLISLRVINVETAFFGAAVGVVLAGGLTLRQAYGAIDWPIIVALGALIPVGEALKDTGATGVMAQFLTTLAAHMPGPVALAFMLATAMVLTPLLHHAAAVLVMGPIAASVASSLHFQVDPFLMAVALGASCDFLTPIGHQNNLLVMGPGGYRFGDYWRLGLPLSVLVILVGTPLLLWAWPLH
jgi:di/tricarboxylate transporter